MGNTLRMSLRMLLVTAVTIHYYEYLNLFFLIVCNSNTYFRYDVFSATLSWLAYLCRHLSTVIDAYFEQPVGLAVNVVIYDVCIARYAVVSTCMWSAWSVRWFVVCVAVGVRRALLRRRLHDGEGPVVQD